MSTRNLYLLGFLIICGLLLTSLYLQFFEGIEPCPLCTLQRLTFVVLGVLFLTGAIFSRSHFMRMMINILSLVFTLGGMVFAGRQIWLQRFAPSDGSECGVSLQYMMQVLPWHQVAQKIFQGTTECAIRGWEFLKLNMAEWAMIWFVAFLFMILYLFRKEKKV